MPEQIPVASLTESQAAAELARLAAEIAGHDRRYHGEDAPLISDAEYDALRRRNMRLRRGFRISCGRIRRRRSVGYVVSEKFAKIAHKVPMLSLDNAFADQDAH